jgi:hypothetical protein
MDCNARQLLLSWLDTSCAYGAVGPPGTRFFTSARGICSASGIAISTAGFDVKLAELLDQPGKIPFVPVLDEKAVG